MNKGCSKKDKKERKEVTNQETETTFIEYKLNKYGFFFLFNKRIFSNFKRL